MTALLAVIAFLWIVVAALLMWSFSLDGYIDTTQERIIRMARFIICAFWPVALVVLLVAVAVSEIMWQFVALPSIRRMDERKKP